MTYTIRDIIDIVDIPTATLVAEIPAQATAIYRMGNGQVITLTILPTAVQWYKKEGVK